MSGTPEPGSQPDPPPASTVAEEKKPVPTLHSPAPWSLFPSGVCDSCGGEYPDHCFQVRDRNNNIVAYIAYDEATGITALELADAALILASPRLLAKLCKLYDGFVFLAGHVPFEPGSIGADEIDRVKLSTWALLEELRKAGVL